MVSYHFSNSCWDWGSVWFSLKFLAIIFLVSATGMLVYRLVMSSEARANWGSMEVSSLLIKSVVFSRLNLLGGGARSLILQEKSLALFCVI